MPVMQKYRPGDFCWVELCTSDIDSAKAFYRGLFGWSHEDLPMTPESAYTMLKIGGRNTAAMYPLDAGQRERRVSPHWTLYINSANVDETAQKIKDAGGTILTEPFDVFTAGRMLVARDPGGASFCVWQARDHIGSEIRNEDNTLCWPELATRDATQARGFYQTVFSYGTKISQAGGGIEYTEWQIDGESIGGMLEMNEQWGDMEPHWMPYFQVADCDAVAQKAGELGGNLLHGPDDIPNVGRFALIQDGQGARFYVIKLTMPL